MENNPNTTTGTAGETTTILVLSDSHGDIENMARAVAVIAPQQIFHLGDHFRDALALARRFPHIPLTAVPGNCDLTTGAAAERMVTVQGVRFLLMHGHTRNVKSSPLPACYAARECGADVLLYGHTHRPAVDFDGQLHVLNPGAAGDRRRPTCGVVRLTDGAVYCAVEDIV